MATKHALITTFIGCAIVLASCGKKCKLEKEDINQGVIVPDVIVYQTHTFGEKVVIDGTTADSNQLELSFDGGYTRVPVDYSKYTLLNFPITTHCDAAFTRKVEFNDVDDIVKYTISVEECDKCNNGILTDNFVVVPKFPASYSVTYKKE